MGASVWGAGSQDLPELDAQATLRFERQSAVFGQTIFEIQTFLYVQNVGSLIVVLNDSILLPGVQYTEISGNTIQLTQPAAAGDIITFLGFVGITVQLTAPSPNTVDTATLSPTLLVPVDKGGTGVTSLAALATALNLGTAATLNVGTNENNVVQLTTGGALPAVSGENLINLPSPNPVLKATIADVVTDATFPFPGNFLTK
jgi:hypothetical protein